LLELDTRVLREAGAGLLAIDAFELLHELAEVVGAEVGVLPHPVRLLQRGQRLFEGVGVDSLHDVPVHLDQTPVSVPGEALVPRREREPLH
jgi:hypothetical protein